MKKVQYEFYTDNDESVTLEDGTIDIYASLYESDPVEFSLSKEETRKLYEAMKTYYKD